MFLLLRRLSHDHHEANGSVAVLRASRGHHAGLRLSPKDYDAGDDGRSECPKTMGTAGKHVLDMFQVRTVSGSSLSDHLVPFVADNCPQ